LKSKSFVFSAGIAKSSLHFCKFDVGRDLQVEALQQDCLMFGWATNALFADRDAGSCGQHEIDQDICWSSATILRGSSPRPARWHYRPEAFQST